MEGLSISQILIQLPVVAIVLVALYYLQKVHRRERKEWLNALYKYLEERNSKTEKAMKSSTDAIERVNESQERITRILMKVADNHQLDEEANNLMKR